MLFCDGRSKSFRRNLEDFCERRCTHVSEMWVVYKPTARCGRRVSFASDNREVCLLVSPVPRTQLKAKPRVSKAGNASGEDSTHCSTYTGVDPLPWRAQPLISTSDKAAIFNLDRLPKPPPKLFDTSMGEPLFWNDRKHMSLWHQILKDVDASAVYDLSPGCGLLGKACLNAGLPYVAFCHFEKQGSFLQNVLDRAAVDAMTKSGFPLYCQDTNALIQEHFKDVVDQWREMELREDTVFDDVENE
jgi:hypothetical protein